MLKIWRMCPVIHPEAWCFISRRTYVSRIKASNHFNLLLNRVYITGLPASPPRCQVDQADLDYLLMLANDSEWDQCGEPFVLPEVPAATVPGVQLPRVPFRFAQSERDAAKGYPCSSLQCLICFHLTSLSGMHDLWRSSAMSCCTQATQFSQHRPRFLSIEYQVGFIAVCIMTMKSNVQGQRIQQIRSRLVLRICTLNKTRRGGVRLCASIGSCQQPVIAAEFADSIVVYSRCCGADRRRDNNIQRILACTIHRNVSSPPRKRGTTSALAITFHKHRVPPPTAQLMQFQPESHAPPLRNHHATIPWCTPRRRPAQQHACWIQQCIHIFLEYSAMRAVNLFSSWCCHCPQWSSLHSPPQQ